MSSSYPVPPPSYAAPGPGPQSKAAYGGTDGATEPLLDRSNNGAWTDEGEHDDIPEDFKVGVSVSQSSIEVRQAFVRKVYAVLFCQILGTTVVGGVMSMDSIAPWVHEHQGLFMIPMVLALVTMLLTYWKRHSHPANILLLGAFTGFEALTIGSIVSLYPERIVLQALIITSFVFIGLTLFTFQSKYDFSSMGSYLFAGLLVLVMTGFIGIFFPFSRVTDMLIAGGACVLFSLYIVYDTHLLLHRLHADDWVMACISLYLDVLNLFLNILRLLSDVQDR